MKLHFCVLYLVLLSCLKTMGGEVPPNVRLELNAIEASNVTAFAYHQKADVGDSYWQGMVRLGTLVNDGGEPDWLPSLKPLEQRIVVLALHHMQHPERAQILSGWYGRYEVEVSRKLRGISDASFATMRADILQKHIPEVEKLRNEHATEEYRAAWEAWLLAPGTVEKDIIMQTAVPALMRLAKDDMIPTLVAMAEIGAKRVSTTKSREMASTLVILNKLKSEASIMAMLKVFDIAKKGKVAPSILMDVNAFREAGDKEAFLDDVFVFSVSGYQPAARPGEYPFQHREGKLFLPTIEAALKRKDLNASHRELLLRTADTIRKYCLGSENK